MNTNKIIVIAMWLICAVATSFGIIRIINISVASEKVVSEKTVIILSQEREFQMGRKAYQYRIMLPDSTIAIYRSNDILYVGDKIKI